MLFSHFSMQTASLGTRHFQASCSLDSIGSSPADLGHEYVLYNLLRFGSVSRPPFVTNRETVGEVYGIDIPPV